MLHLKPQRFNFYSSILYYQYIKVSECYYFKIVTILLEGLIYNLYQKDYIPVRIEHTKSKTLYITSIHNGILILK